MPAPKVSDAEFIELWKTLRSASKISKTIGIDVSSVHQRRRRIEQTHKIQLVASDQSRSKNYAHLQTAHIHAARHQLGIENGTVIVFSDAHFWPGIRTTAFKGLLWAIREFKPKAIINNGDAFDGASISRYPRIGSMGTSHVKRVSDSWIRRTPSQNVSLRTIRKERVGVSCLSCVTCEST